MVKIIFAQQLTRLTIALAAAVLPLSASAQVSEEH
jgi:hypothetical protein